MPAHLHRLVLFALSLPCLAAQALDAPRESQLANGAPLIATLDKEAPRQSVQIVFTTGCRVLPQGHESAGVMLQNLFEEGPLAQSAMQYRRELFLINTQINAYVDGRTLWVSITAPPETLEAALQKATQLLREPKLTESEVAAARQKVITFRQSVEQDARSVAYLAQQHYAYGHHPDVGLCLNSLPTMQSMGVQDVKQAWQALTQPNRLLFSTIGPLAPAKVGALLEATVLKGVTQRYEALPRVPPPEFRKPESTSGTDVILVERPDAQDNQLLFVWPQQLQVETPDFATAELAMSLLGGGSAGRLFQELREKRGLTYGASASISRAFPHYIAGTFGGADKIGRLITELPQVYQDYLAQAPSQQSLTLAADTLTTRFRQSTELPVDAFALTLNAKLLGRDPTAWQQRPERWRAVSVESLQRFNKERMVAKPSFLFLVGDPKVLMPALEQAGYPKASIKTVQLDDL